MSERGRQTLTQWALEYNAYARLAGDPARLGNVLQPLRDEYRDTGEVPEWAGIDLLRGWAFWCVRAHRHGGGYSPLDEEFPEFMAIVETLRRHPAAMEVDRPPPRRR